MTKQVQDEDFNMIFFGLGELQIVELILLAITSGLVVGTFLGLIMRGIKLLL